MPTQTAKFGEKKSDASEAAAVQNETHLRGRGGEGAAAGPDRTSSRKGASNTYLSLTWPPPCSRRYKRFALQERKPKLTATSRSYVRTELEFQARLSDPKPCSLLSPTQRQVGLCRGNSKPIISRRVPSSDVGAAREREPGIEMGARSGGG